MAQGDEVLGGEDGHLVCGSFWVGGDGGMTFGCGWAEEGRWGGVDWTGGGGLAFSTTYLTLPR